MKFICLKYFILLVILCSSVFSNAQQNKLKIRKKIIFIYNIAKNVDWDQSKNKNFTIGFFNIDSVIYKELLIIAPIMKINNKSIDIVIVDTTNLQTKDYDIIYQNFNTNNINLSSKISNTCFYLCENNTDIKNVMFSFVFNDSLSIGAFALNKTILNTTKLKTLPEFEKSSIYIYEKSAPTSQKIASDWKTLVTKKSLIYSNVKSNSLGLNEINTVLNKINSQLDEINNQNNKIKIQNLVINEQSGDLSSSLSQLSMLKSEAISQQKKLNIQKKLIKEQSFEIIIQEKRIVTTLQEVKRQNDNLEITKRESVNQQNKINNQKNILRNQKQNINQQSEKLITQLGQINSQKSILYLAGFLVLVIAGALFIAYKGNKNKQKANALLMSQKSEIEKQKHLVEEKHKEITDSINYAERIQYSFLATKELLDENLKNYFVYFKPKAIVSGDFYWGSKLNNGNFALVTADSTGHGVPGAIMSLLNITSLENAIKETSEPAEILNLTRKTIIDRLKKDGSVEGGKDGMDCSLVVFNKANNKLIVAAANNPIWIIRQNNLIAVKPDKMPVGKHDRDSEVFTQHEFELQSGDMVYTLTDGFPDQFGGPKGKKFKYKQLEELLVSISHESMEIQKQKLNHVFENWKGNLEQVDDVCIIGVRV